VAEVTFQSVRAEEGTGLCLFGRKSAQKLPWMAILSVNDSETCKIKSTILQNITCIQTTECFQLLLSPELYIAAMEVSSVSI
jgi:hypothetical protein